MLQLMRYISFENKKFILENTDQNEFIFCKNIEKTIEQIQTTAVKNQFISVSCFNAKGIFIKKQTVSLDELQSKLIELGFYIFAGKFIGYRPPIKKYLFNKLNFLEKIGNRWFARYANSFILIVGKK